MLRDDAEKLREDLLEQIAAGARTIALVGSDELGLGLIDFVSDLLPACSANWYGDQALAVASGRARSLADLASDRPDVVVVLDDADKEATLLAAAPYLTHETAVLVAGYAHYRFRDDLFEQLLADLHVPSIANGYENTLVHLYECVTNAARLELEGALVEFGVFKGGTTMFLARLARALDRNWRVIGFDTFGGFPPRRSPFDMYSHPGAVFTDFASVERYLGAADVELIRGDIVDTARQLADIPVVVAFVDTDNYSSAKAAVEALRDNVVVGGAIVFDHLTGVARFRYTLGERIAARELLADDARYFNLHGTGVFMRQK